MNLKGSFRSYGGEIEQGEFKGLREEIWVELGIGKVTNIKLKDDKSVANVQFTVEGADYPVAGWIRTDDEVFQFIEYAEKNNVDVEYRIECQRKKGIPKDIPILKLRESITEANKNTTRIIAGINDEPTNEAMTDPSEDDEVRPKNEEFVPHRTSAIKQNQNKVENTSPQQSNVQPNTSQQGSQQPQTPQGNSRPQQQQQGAKQPMQGNIDPAWMKNREPAAYVEFNPDNRTIYPGSLHAQGFFSANIMVRNIIRKHNKENATVNVSEEEIAKYTTATIALADKIHQACSLFKRVDRQSNHHTRIRGIVFDIIENEIGLPLESEDMTYPNNAAWFQAVGKLAYARYMSVLKIMNEGTDISSFLGTEATNDQSNENSPQGSTAQNGNPSNQTTAVNNPSEVKVPESLEAMTKQEEAVVTPFMFPKYEIPKPSNDGTLYADKPMIDAYIKMAEDTDTVDNSKKLLVHTFGTYNMSQIPKNIFGDFLTHYLRNQDNYNKAMRMMQMKGAVG